MPTYVYKFLDSGETIEVQQSFTDESLTEYVHPESGELLPVKKVFQPVGVTFKGSGFFKTDHRDGKTASTAGGSSSADDSSGSSSDSKPGSTEKSTSSPSSTPSDAPAAAKPAATSSGSGTAAAKPTD